MVQQKKPMSSEVTGFCRRSGLSRHECIKNLSEDIQSIADRVQEKHKNEDASNAPMCASDRM
jgi:hypothetical protein